MDGKGSPARDAASARTADVLQAEAGVNSPQVPQGCWTADASRAGSRPTEAPESDESVDPSGDPVRPVQRALAGKLCEYLICVSCGTEFEIGLMKGCFRCSRSPICFYCVDGAVREEYPVHTCIGAILKPQNYRFPPHGTSELKGYHSNCWSVTRGPEDPDGYSYRYRREWYYTGELLVSPRFLPCHPDPDATTRSLSPPASPHRPLRKGCGFA